MTAAIGTDRRVAGRSSPAQPACAVVQELREAAFQRFAELGFPTTHDEEWRFTNVAPIARTNFRVAGSAAELRIPAGVQPMREGRAAVRGDLVRSCAPGGASGTLSWR